MCSSFVVLRRLGPASKWREAYFVLDIHSRRKMLDMSRTLYRFWDTLKTKISISWSQWYPIFLYIRGSFAVYGLKTKLQIPKKSYIKVKVFGVYYSRLADITRTFTCLEDRIVTHMILRYKSVNKISEHNTCPIWF